MAHDNAIIGAKMALRSVGRRDDGQGPYDTALHRMQPNLVHSGRSSPALGAERW
jgi:hypothetical protein